jgi:hypothetical protein
MRSILIYEHAAALIGRSPAKVSRKKTGIRCGLVPLEVLPAFILRIRDYTESATQGR